MATTIQQTSTTSSQGKKACDQCFKSKTKCDMNEAGCATCKKKGIDCTFLIPKKKRGPKSKPFCSYPPDLVSVPTWSSDFSLSPSSGPLYSSGLIDFPDEMINPFPSSGQSSPLLSPSNASYPTFIYELNSLHDYMNYLNPHLYIVSYSDLMIRISSPKSIYFEFLLTCMTTASKIWLSLNPKSEDTQTELKNAMKILATLPIPTHFDKDYNDSIKVLDFINKYMIFK
jgi:hypothetical protein